jgi:hypothetical protein
MIYLLTAYFLITMTTLLNGSSRAHATSYLFTVSCESRRFVVDWETGSVDPGREYLRAATGTKNAGCMVGDYSAARDSKLPRDKYSDWGGVLQAFPPVFFFCGLFHSC